MVAMDGRPSLFRIYAVGSPMHEGTGPGLSNRRLGERGGQETVTLTEDQIPKHGHSVSDATASQASPKDGVPAIANDGESNYAPTGDDTSAGSGGGGQAHPNMPPYLAINYIIALEGVFPSRN